MLDKIIDFLEQYCYTKKAIKKIGKYKTVSMCLLELINAKFYTIDKLRKELSIHTKRIISVTEFYKLLEYDRVEYEQLLYS